MKPIAFLGLLTVALSGCSAQAGMAPPVRQDPEQIFVTATPSADPEAVSQIWCMELVGKTAVEIAEAQDSPFEGWEHTVNMCERSYYRDPKNGAIEYLFPNDGDPLLGEEEICCGVLVDLESCFSLHSNVPQEMIQELSDVLNIAFEWGMDEVEETYGYHSNFESAGKRYQIVINTDSQKQFSTDTVVELTLTSENP